MINFNELRVGNWILESGEPSNVYSLQRGGISFYTINDINVNKQTGAALNGGEDRFSPIPLSPEILEECGFEYRVEDKVWFIQVGNTNYLEFDESMCCGVTPETWSGKCPIYIWGQIKHLHQLQNLFYFLAEDELLIDEKVFRKTAEKYS